MNVQTTGAAAPGTFVLQISATGGGVTATVPLMLDLGQVTITPASTIWNIKRRGLA